MNEQEIKLRFENPREMRHKLEALGASIYEPRHFEDNFLLDTAEQRLRNNRIALRVRIANNNGLLTLKGAADTSKGIKSREEIECELSEPQHLLQIFSRLGYVTSFRYQKYRTVYQIAGLAMDFCLDETPIGNFLELEGEPEDIHEYAKRLGYSGGDYITDSYAALYFQWAAKNHIKATEMIFA